MRVAASHSCAPKKAVGRITNDSDVQAGINIVLKAIEVRRSARSRRTLGVELDRGRQDIRQHKQSETSEFAPRLKSMST